LVVFGVDVVSTVIGIWAMRFRTVGDKFKAISAGIMVGVALFWIFPDLMQKSGVVHAALIIGVGLATLCGI
jgi:zinc transporter ZupT